MMCFIISIVRSKLAFFHKREIISKAKAPIGLGIDCKEPKDRSRTILFRLIHPDAKRTLAH